MSYSSESLTDSKSLSIFERLSRSFREFQLLVQSIPTVTFALFIVAVFSMNLLANKSVDLPVSWLALDCGFIVSWFVFLVLDILTKHFGPKAATQISIFAMVLNLLLCGIFFLVSLVPGTWGESYVEGSEVVINTALNNTFGGTKVFYLQRVKCMMANIVLVPGNDHGLFFFPFHVLKKKEDWTLMRNL